MKRAIIMALISLVIVGGLTAWFLLNFERKEVPDFTGYTGEARYNRFLAAERFAESAGAVAFSVASLPPDDLPDVLGTVLLFSGRVGFTPEENDLLLDWVNDGGHLVVSAEDISLEIDTIFKAIKVDYVSADQIEFEEEPVESDEPQGEQQAEAEEETETAADDPESVEEPGDGILIKNSYLYGRLKSNGQWTQNYSDRYGILASRNSYGNGIITAVMSSDFINNGYLEDGDHAYLFWRMLNDPGDPGDIWLVYGQGSADLLTLLWRHAPYAYVLTGILILFFLWQRTQRFGPLLPTPKSERRSLLEHIRAAGLFQVKHQSEPELLDHSRDAMLRECTRWFPQIRRLDANEQARLLQQHTNLKSDLVRLALGHTDNHDFVSQINAIQKLREHL